MIIPYLKSKFAKLAKVKKMNLIKLFIFFVGLGIVAFSFWRTENIKPAVPNFNVGSIRGSKESKSQSKPVKVKNFSLSIARIGVSAPVVPNVSGVEKEYLKALERGVVQFKGSSFPGQGGNIVIFGHSAYYWNKPGDYKEIFRNLENLKIDDLIKIDFNHKQYLYRVTKTMVVDPSNARYMRPTKKERLTLITCVPPGTTKYRLIVIAEPKRD